MAIPLMAIMAGAGAMNEGTTGREQQTRDAQVKATAYRMMAYLKGLNPESFDVRVADPYGGAAQGAMSGYGLQSQMARNDAANTKDLAIAESLTGKNQIQPQQAAPTGVAMPESAFDLGTGGRTKTYAPNSSHASYTPYRRLNTFMLG